MTGNATGSAGCQNVSPVRERALGLRLGSGYPVVVTKRVWAMAGTARSRVVSGSSANGRTAKRAALANHRLGMILFAQQRETATLE